MVVLSWLIIMGWMLSYGMSLCFVKGCSGEEKGPEQQQFRSQASLPTDVFPLSVRGEAEVEECTITCSCSRTCTLLPRVRCCSWHRSFLHKYDHSLLLRLGSGSFQSSHKSNTSFAKRIRLVPNVHVGNQVQYLCRENKASSSQVFRVDSPGSIRWVVISLQTFRPGSGRAFLNQAHE